MNGANFFQENNTSHFADEQKPVWIILSTYPYGSGNAMSQEFSSIKTWAVRG